MMRLRRKLLRGAPAQVSRDAKRSAFSAGNAIRGNALRCASRLTPGVRTGGAATNGRRLNGALIALAILVALLLAPTARAATRNILAHGSDQRFWVVRVAPYVANPTSPPAPGSSVPLDQSRVLVRETGPGTQWHDLATLSSRVVAVAHVDTNLAVLLEDGSWMLVWAADGTSVGTPLPANGKLLTFASDDAALWAIGEVPGGAGAAIAATQAATQPASMASTMPAAGPATAEAIVLPPASKLVLFQQQNGTWIARGNLPADVVPAMGSTPALSVAQGRATIAVDIGSQQIRTLQRSADGTWDDVAVTAVPFPIEAFDLVQAGPKLLLWASSGVSPGTLFPLEGAGAAIPLRWSGNTTPDALPDITWTGGWLRVVGLHDNRLYGQRYDTSGNTDGNAVELAIPSDQTPDRIRYWLTLVVTAALAASLMAGIRQRAAMRRAHVDFVPPSPAPLLPRLAAGLIDAMPIIIATILIQRHNLPGTDAVNRIAATPALIGMLISAGVYILHTTITEMIFARSLGKYLLGLRVVAIDGKPATVPALLLRNLLRVIDLFIAFLPLVLVIISPLRQRVGDAAAGTMVVGNQGTISNEQ